MEERERGIQPLDKTATGCTLVFVPTGPGYQPLAALAVLAALHGKGFTGICESYILPDIREGEYLMGVGLDFLGNPPEDAWWASFVDCVQLACKDDEEVGLHGDVCEFATVGELRATMRHAGTAGFQAGSAVWVSDPAGPDPDSPFTALARRCQKPLS
jgi:hypothetical protein